MRIRACLVEVVYRLRREELARLAQEQVNHPPPEEPDRPQSEPHSADLKGAPFSCRLFNSHTSRKNIC
jgi:hypothetical protein